MSSFETESQTLKSYSSSYEYEFTSEKKVVVGVKEMEDSYYVKFAANWDNLVLHWGVGLKRAKDWACPNLQSQIKLPDNTTQFDDKASQSPFVELGTDCSICEITFESKDQAPKQLNFVLKREGIWYNNNGMNYGVTIKVEPRDFKFATRTNQELADEIIEAEMSHNSWTLMHRFNMCREWLYKVQEDLDGLAWIFVWMRYSQLRKLDWQRNYNTKPRELSHAQKELTIAIAEKITQASSEGLVSPLVMYRNILRTFGKGGDSALGQRIRDGILELMHKHKMREVFYEEWHQKLHNNTTPDDIGICEAAIAFNETGDMSKYWEVLDSHGITKERLKSFERGIHHEPSYVPQILPELYEFLKVLKAVHSSTDIISNTDHVRGFASGELMSKLEEILQNLEHFDKILQMERVGEARKLLERTANKQDLGQFREFVYLDISLEVYLRQLCEQIIHYDIKAKHLTREIKVLVQNLVMLGKNQEIQVAFEDWEEQQSRYAEQIEEKENALIMKASGDRILRALGAYVDAYNSLIDSKSKYLGEQFEVEDEVKNIFTEEVIRGSLVFAVSMVSKKLDKQLRELGGVKPWQFICPVPKVQGQLRRVSSLHEVSYKKYEERTILVAEKVSGEEEIPEGVVGVICGTEIDALAHVCVRARNARVLLAVCFNFEELQEIEKLDGQWVEGVMASSGGLEVTPSQQAKQVFSDNLSAPMHIKKPKAMKDVVIDASQFEEGVTGSKANNCAFLKNLPRDTFKVPGAVAVPYRVCEHMLSLPVNSERKAKIQELEGMLEGEVVYIESKEILDEIKKLVMEIEVGEEEKQKIAQGLQKLGIKSSDWEEAWKGIKSVWSSKYNERAYLNLMKKRASITDVRMSVLCQEVVTGDYAYVLHTKNPFNNNQNEIYGELVLGLGETLVGAYEGKSFSFVVNKNTGEIDIKSFPNKSVALRGSGYIFRSDSNSEDLAEFAGAGLFDSFLMQEAQSEVLSYKQERIYSDKAFRTELIENLKQIGIQVEEAFRGVPQDIEGVIKDGQYYVVQSRAQV